MQNSITCGLLASVTSFSILVGLDSAELVSQMRAAHAASDDTRVGVDVVLGMAGDMKELGIYEAFKVREPCNL